MKNKYVFMTIILFLLVLGFTSNIQAEISRINIDKDMYLVENFDRFKSIKSPKLALALSGGGARGFVNLGVIKALDEEGIYPDIIIGSSMGGIISTLYGSGLDYNSIETIITTLPYRTLFDINLIPVYSVFQTDKLNYFLELVSPHNSIENFPIATALLTFDLDSGYKYIASEGKISKVLQSTYSIPFYYPIQKSKGRHLMDPGIVEMVPVKAAKALTADIVIATTAFDELPYDTYKYPLQSLLRMLLLVQQRNAQPILEDYSDIIVDNDVSDFDFKDFDMVERFIEIGYENTKRMMPEIKRVLEQKNYKSSKPNFVTLDKSFYENLYTDILFDRIIYPNTHFKYLLYYFNSQSFFEQDLFRKIVYDFHYGFFFEKSHFQIKTLFDVDKDRHTETMLRYKKLTENTDLIFKLKNNAKFNSIDYLGELKYFIKNSSISVGVANLNLVNYYYLNNNVQLEGRRIDFQNNIDLLLHSKKQPQIINSSIIDYDINNSWKYTNKFIYSNTNLLGNPDIYRGLDSENKEKISLSTALTYSVPFSESPELLYFFSLEQLNPSVFLDIESTDEFNYALGINFNMVSSIMGLKPLNLDLSTAYDKNAGKLVYNFSVDIKF
ncbi:MAG: patatin-like phospholipase family protein [Halanaerobiales bacterium]|nr:patatin-like phospholipase family protein [Halanaerobiales bacterium]